MFLMAATVLFAASAQAIPIVYVLDSGQVTVTATVSGNPVAGPVVIPLTGTLVTVDEGALQLTSIQLAAANPSGAITISPSYLGFTSINIDFATLSASGGTLSVFDPGPPVGYNYSIAPVTIAGQFDATNIIPANSLTNQPFGFINALATGDIYVDTGVAIALNGITLGSIDPDGPGGADPLVLKGDFLFQGVIPEPGTAILLGLGLVGVAARRRSA
jgi:hypothetical protein